LPPEARDVRDAFLPAHLRAVAAAIPASDADRACDLFLLALGVRLMLRRGELALLTVADVRESATGIQVRVHRPKTQALRPPVWHSIRADPQSPVCPVALWRLWRAQLLERGFQAGALFRAASGAPLSGADINAVVQRRARQAGLTGRFTGHSLRIGGATALAAAGATDAEIAAIGGWALGSDALRRYIRPGALDAVLPL
jgi:integrase